MIGQTISHYKITEKLGSGGMGTVYKAFDLTLNRNVAIKFLPLSFSSNKSDKKRFIQEAQTASSLDHPNIYTIHEIQETAESQLYIVMGFYEGETLAQKLAEQPLPFKQTLNIFGQLMSGVFHAHSRGIIHRDLKPSNIIITLDGTVKILDFGLARHTESEPITKTGTTQGTVAYMSPEHAQGLETDYRTDIWSMGVIFYQMLAGELPFKGRYYQALMYSIVNLDPPPVREISPDVSEELQLFIDKALQKEVDNRFQSVDEMFQKFEAIAPDWAEGTTSSGVAVAFRPRIKKKFPIRKKALVVLLIAIVILVVWQVLNQPALKPDGSGNYSVAVADVINTTNRNSLNSISGYLITSLEQSRKLNVLTREQMLDILYSQEKTRVDRIDELTARKVSRDADIDILVVPTIREFNDTFTVEVRLLDPIQNKSFGTNIERGVGLEAIPDLIDSHSAYIRTWLRENDAEIQTTRKKLTDITTENIFAYNYYSIGEEALKNRDLLSARVAFENAIAIDSTFGLAYYRLAQSTGWSSGEEQPERKLLLKALDLIDRIPEKYRYLVLARKAWVERGPAGALVILRQMEEFYPHEKEMLCAIASASFSVRDFGDAITYGNRILAMDPANLAAFQLIMKTFDNKREFNQALVTAEKFKQFNPQKGAFEAGKIQEQLRDFPAAVKSYQVVLEKSPRDKEALSHLMSTYRKMGRMEEMKETAVNLMHAADSDYFFREAGYSFALAGDFDLAFETLSQVITLFPDRANYARLEMATMYDYTEQYDQAEKLLRSMIASPLPDQIKRLAYDRLFRTLLYTGRFRQALQVSDDQMAFFRQMPKFIAEVELRKALTILWGWNDIDAAKKEAQPVLTAQQSLSSPDYWIYLSSFYYHANMLDSALKLIKATFSNQGYFNEMSIIYSITGECGRAQVLVDSLAGKTSAWERVRALYHLSKGYDRIDRPDLAIKYLKQLQKEYSHFAGFRAVYYPKSYFLLAKQYEKRGDILNAIVNYQKFLELWKDADKDLPDLLEATIRLSQLKHNSQK